MAESRMVDFNALPRTVRERLSACLNGKSKPEPILSEVPSQSSSAAGWVLLANLGGIAGALVAAQDYGQSLQGPAAVGLYAACTACLVFSVLQTRRHARLRSALPFKPGRYVLPRDFVDARDRRIRVVALDELTGARAEGPAEEGARGDGDSGAPAGAARGGHAVVLAFEGGVEESFAVRDEGGAEKALRKLREARADVRLKVESDDAEGLKALDPFAEARAREWQFAERAPGQVEGPSARSVPALLRLPAIAALTLLLAGGLAFPLFALRNRMSDDAMFEAAVEDGSEAALRRYAGKGVRHVDEVKNSLLPRAAFKEADRANSLSELRAFLVSYPGSAVDKEARAAIHSMYARAMIRFRDQAATTDPRLLPFMEKLIAYLEAHPDGRVEVRFQRPSAESLAEVDSLVQSKAGSALGAKNVVPVAPHFDEWASSRRETRIADSVKSGFSAIFADEIMRVVLGERTPRGETPTIEVRYRISGGDLYREAIGDRMFVGIVVDFDVVMRIPGEPDVFDFTFQVSPPEHFEVTYQDRSRRAAEDFLPFEIPADAPASRPTEGRVYEEMAARAFGQLSRKLREVFFRPESEAAKAPTIPAGAQK